MGISLRIVSSNRVRYDLFIAVIAPIVFFWIAIQTSPGPSYTSDEFAYLAKAAALAGNAVNYPSSWHAGYPLLISPVFRVGLSPYDTWIVVLFVNCVFWIGSFLVLSRLIRIWFPNLSEVNRGFVILITSLYPGWVVIGAYAFSNSAFVFFYLLIFLVQSNSKTSERTQSILSFTLIGLLYWIHPIGLAVLLAFLVSQLWTVRIRKVLIERFTLSLISVFLILIYSRLIHPGINQNMLLTDFLQDDHYSSHFADRLAYVRSTAFWTSFVFQVLGIWGAISVATLGVIFLPMVKTFQLRFRDQPPPNAQPADGFSLVFGISSVILVSLLTAFVLTLPLRSGMQLDHWIFLRYVECVLLPLLPVGLAALYFNARTSLRWTVGGVPISLFLIGWMLDSDLSVRGPTSQVDNHFVMTIGFWPVSLMNHFRIDDWSNSAPSTSVHYSDFSFRTWMLLGAVGIIICFLKSRIVLLGFCLILFAAVNNLQTEWHRYIYNQYANPPKAVSQIRSLPTPSSCTGFMKAPLSELYRDEYLIFTYYLYDYKLRITSKEDWFKFCDGPLIVEKSDFGDAADFFKSFDRRDADRYFVVVRN